MKKETLTFTAKLKELKAENTKLKLEAEGANQTACNFQELAIKHERAKNEAERLKRKYYDRNKEGTKTLKCIQEINRVHTIFITDLLRREERAKTHIQDLYKERTYRHIALAVSITFNLVIGFAALTFIIDKYI